MQPINAVIRLTDKGYHIHVDDKDYFQSQLSKVGDGQRCSVQIDKPVMSGTDEQNRFMHALLNNYFDTGMHDMPEYFRNTHAGFKVFYKEQFARFNKVPESWSKYSKAQRMAFIEFIIQDIRQSEAIQESIKLQEIIQGAEKNSYYGLK